jgi:hypothetical protein
MRMTRSRNHVRDRRHVRTWRRSATRPADLGLEHEPQAMSAASRVVGHRELDPGTAVVAVNLSTSPVDDQSVF